MKIRRKASHGASTTSTQRRIVWQAASLLLAHPDDDQGQRLNVVEKAVAGSLGELSTAVGRGS